MIWKETDRQTGQESLLFQESSWLGEFYERRSGTIVVVDVDGHSVFLGPRGQAQACMHACEREMKNANALRLSAD